MKILKTISYLVVCCCFSCASGPKQKTEPPLSADFALGKINVVKQSKAQNGGYELTLLTRYELKKQLDPSLSNYFQYQLGKKISLVIGKDTIQPSLSYYVPLIDGVQKEIDCKYLLQDAEKDKPKRMIINDAILDFNKVDISFK
jgi:hypothetical protein